MLGCGTANGRLPERYITSIQEGPRNPSTVYVTLGGYDRRWIPPGSFGESGATWVGHVFVSHDHGKHFTNITGNLPDISANWTGVHNGKLSWPLTWGCHHDLVRAAGATSGRAGKRHRSTPCWAGDSRRLRCSRSG